MSRRIRHLGLLLAVAGLALVVATPGAFALPNGKAPGVGLKAIRDVAAKTISAQKSARRTPPTHTSAGARTAALVQRLPRLARGTARVVRLRRGQDGVRSALLVPDRYPDAASSGRRSTRRSRSWGRHGDAVSGQVYHFDFAAGHVRPDELRTTRRASPTSGSRTTSGPPAEAALNDRCHLASSSPFTSPANTPLAEAQSAARVGRAGRRGCGHSLRQQVRVEQEHRRQPRRQVHLRRLRRERRDGHLAAPPSTASPSRRRRPARSRRRSTTTTTRRSTARSCSRTR